MVLPTGAGKSLLFMAPAALPLARVTVVIVPYVALSANLEAKAKAAGVAYTSYKPGFRAVVPLVFASVEQLSFDLPQYLRSMHEANQLQRIVVDEAHVMLTEWRFREKALKELKRVADFCATCQVLLLTATLPPSLDEAIAKAYCLPNLIIR
jgi:superfamily II DNA helicase RecQ